MDLQKINWKFFFENPQAARPEDFFKVFNTWIPGSPEIFIDVADYKHVHDGPLTVLIGHYTDYSLDATNRRLGFLYNSKRPLEGSQEERLAGSLKEFIKSCNRLTSDPIFKGKLKFNPKELQLMINDRALAPNSQETFKTIEGVLKKVVSKVVGHSDFSLKHLGYPKRRFAVSICLKHGSLI